MYLSWMHGAGRTPSGSAFSLKTPAFSILDDYREMGTLYIDRKDLEIRLDGYAMAFYANGVREGIVPIKPLKRIVMVGNITIETPVLHRLADEGVSVIFLSGKTQRYRGVFHGRLHNNGLLRLMQYKKSGSPFAAEFSKEIMVKKITLQKDLLEDADKDRHDLRTILCRGISTLESVIEKINNMGLDIETESLMGFEGGAAASYFAAYTSLFPESLGFTGRTKRPPRDPVNAVLSLTYTLLHYEVVREIESIGLDPFIGFYHQFDYGRESLACDIVEPYRPCVDRWVWELFRKRTFTGRDFNEGEERPGCYLKKEGRSRYYVLYEEWADGIRKMIRDEVQILARRITDGQDAIPEREQGDDDREGWAFPLDHDGK